LLAGAAALGAAAAVLAAVCMRMPSGKDYSPLAVCDEAADFFQNESPAPSHPLGEVSPPADFPLSCEVSPAAQVRWRPIQGFLGRAGVAYDLTPPAGMGGAGLSRATLYVIPRRVAGLATRPPLQPRPSTAGCSTAAWQEGDLLYVLVVGGGGGAYRGYLRMPSGPLT
jgi:hypothetical protein